MPNDYVWPVIPALLAVTGWRVRTLGQRVHVRGHGSAHDAAVGGGSPLGLAGAGRVTLETK